VRVGAEYSVAEASSKIKILMFDTRIKKAKYCRRSNFRDNSVAVNNPTFAYNIIIFIDQTSAYTIIIYTSS